MKKLLFVFFFSILSQCIYAQTEQGNFLFGGGFSASFGTQKIESPINSNTTRVTENRTTSVTFTPNAGFFIADNFAIGLFVDANSTSYRDKDNDEKSNSSYLTLGPQVRYYFPAKFFLEGKVGFGSGKDYVYGESKILNYSFGAGYAAFLNDHVAIEPMIRYQGINYTDKNNEDFKNKNGALVIGVGLQIYL